MNHEISLGHSTKCVKLWQVDFEIPQQIHNVTKCMKDIHDIAQETPQKHFEGGTCVRSSQIKTNTARISAGMTLRASLRVSDHHLQHA